MTMRRSVKGQTAIGFLVVMGFILVLVTMTINLGQMAQVRVETSNAADAGALAGASWMASGQNEAAMVAQRMLEGLPLAQALYLVPFCPDPSGTSRHRDYADRLWQSLVMHPVTLEDGPFKFLSRVADGAMWAAWHIGKREMLTASANNMMMRFVTNVDSDARYTDLAEELEDRQLAMDRSLTWRIHFGGTLLDWDNGLAEDDPGFLRHDVEYYFEDYPDDPPTMSVTGVPRPSFIQHRGEVDSTDPTANLDCRDDGWGVNAVWDAGFVGPLSGPFAQLPTNLSEYPLAIDIMGRKNWDRDWGEMLPALEHMTGVCPAKVCSGFNVVAAGASQDIRPQAISGGTGQVTMRIVHEVVTQNGTTTIPDPESHRALQIPLWSSRFEPVASRATARFSQASVPNSNARAWLETSE